MAKDRRVDDQAAMAMLTYCAVIEIRAMARRHKPLASWPGDDYVACIAWLADLVHNIAMGARRESRWTFWRKQQRPMAWTWAVAGPAGQAWILATLAREGLEWTPPPLPNQASDIDG
ncbi:hypothetical protein G9272_16745 [Streptomyces asoensis]|uniref:Uncharacterized protein n=1 Tax=Streptomyces asoensis TaxID=249586 RepID=A0A6M4WV19_9ACTN|nr:hypothetical protein [Streptomyces asoensis]QJT01756.1 hypothetical protein G9272_16745 [Streptomyces asoensis]